MPGLDAVLGGGLVSSGVYIFVGEPGAGKTLFANQLCYHQGRAGARCLYVTLLAESHARMLANMRDMAFFDSALLPEGVYYVSGFRTLEEHGLPGLLELLRREVRNHNASILVLDGLVQAQEAAGSSRDFKKFIHELQVAAGLTRFTALLLTSANGPAVHPEYTMVDGILELRERTQGVRSWRELQVRKFRGSPTLHGVHAFRITSDGLEVFPGWSRGCSARRRRTRAPIASTSAFRPWTRSSRRGWRRGPPPCCSARLARARRCWAAAFWRRA
ncbi:ATPase domain-containing protein [Myxococcus sp. MxC21-1]|uniref:RAD55 family ATPase n=1 Tax=Myxococcus sp. MxC21-1 TaxID=3041439 RepID=UPI00292DD6E8|nr:ATPase domain-containing protein [Myxococcus sp. MxC21-1]WNZ62989.1 ATPase domain-containing protein [Myxococcus sp. MxC21-1]